MSGGAFDVAVLLAAVAAAHGGWLVADIYSPQNDYLLHYLWAGQFADSLSQGIWRPAWVPSSRGGLGDPVFVYYVPLFYYLTAAAERLTGDMWLAIKLVCALSALATGAVVTGFARGRGLGAGWARWLGALAILLPVLLVVRGTINAYPWFVAHLFLALAMVALLRCLEAPGPGRIAALALAVAALALTHTLSTATFLLTASVGLLADWAFVDRSRAGFTRGLAIASAFVLGLAVAAPALLPAVATLDLIRPSGWDHTDPGMPAWFNTFSFPLFTEVDRIPYAWLMPWGSFVLLPVFCWAAWRARPLPPPVRALVWIVAVSFFLGTELSYPLWDHAALLHLVQRPFRFLSPLTFALLIGAVPLLLSQPVRGAGLRQTRVPVWMGLLGLLAMVPLPVLYADQIRDQRLDPSRAALTTPASLSRFFGVPEHLPATAGPGWRAYLDAGGFEAECRAQEAVCEGGAVTAQQFDWRIDSAQAVRLRLPLMGYAAWQLSVDGMVQDRLMDGATGLLAVDLPRGEHRVAAIWQPLPEQRTGDRIGLLALALWLGLVAAAQLRRRTRAMVGPA